MKNKVFTILAGLMSLALVGSIIAQQQIGATAFGIGGTAYNASGLTNYAVVTRHSQIPNAHALITFVSATSDKTASTIQFWSPSYLSPAPVGYTNSTTTVYVSATNQMANLTNIVIEHVVASNSPTYEICVLTGGGTFVSSNVTVSGIGGVATTNYVWSVPTSIAPVSTVFPGDNIGPLIPGGTIPVGVGSQTLTGTGIYASARDKPLVLEILGGTNATINAVGGVFVP